jgi:coenzyme F420-reducing hydrogenase alpha subunit
MERSVAQIVEANIAQPKDKIEFEIEKTIRAYDPCMICASHFLKVKWRQSR